MDPYYLRNLAIECLDDEHGITMDAWHAFVMAFQNAGVPHNDFLTAVDGQDGRVYLPEDHGITPDGGD